MILPMSKAKTRNLIILAFVILALLIAAALPRYEHQNHPYFDNFDSYPLVIAHADDTGQGLWPGSTMVFLEGATQLGVDVLEIDVHMSKDGHIVVMHDDTVDRTTNGSGKISQLTLKEIKELEVGANWSPDGGSTYPYREAGLRVPTVAEVFTLFPDKPLNIEIKQEDPSLAQPLCDLIRHFNMSDRVLVPSFSDKAMSEFRAACPEVATVASSSEVRKFVAVNFAFLSKFLAAEYEAFQVPEESSGIPVVIPHFVHSAHDSNLQVHIWTVNDPADMERFIAMGVDGIMTDRPDLLLDILGRR